MLQMTFNLFINSNNNNNNQMLNESSYGIEIIGINPRILLFNTRNLRLDFFL